MTRRDRRAAKAAARVYIPGGPGGPGPTYSAVDVAGIALFDFFLDHPDRRKNWLRSRATNRLWLEWIADTTTELEWQGRLAYTADCLSSGPLGKPPTG